MATPLKVSIPVEIHSWRLDHISPTTYPNDVVSLRVPCKEMTKKEIHAVHALIRSGACYRFRIAKGRHFYGRTPQEAVDLGYKDWKKKHGRNG